MKKEFGWTTPGFNPAYINVTKDDDGRVRFTLRGEGSADGTPGPHAELIVPERIAREILGGMVAVVNNQDE